MEKLFRIELTGTGDENRLKALLKAHDWEVLSVSHEKTLYPVNLIVDGDLIDSTDVWALDEDDARLMALHEFLEQPDYDVIPSHMITLNMIQIDRG